MKLCLLVHSLDTIHLFTPNAGNLVSFYFCNLSPKDVYQSWFSITTLLFWPSISIIGWPSLSVWYSNKLHSPLVTTLPIFIFSGVTTIDRAVTRMPKGQSTGTFSVSEPWTMRIEEFSCSWLIWIWCWPWPSWASKLPSIPAGVKKIKLEFSTTVQYEKAVMLTGSEISSARNFYIAFSVKIFQRDVASCWNESRLVWVHWFCRDISWIRGNY